MQNLSRKVKADNQKFILINNLQMYIVILIKTEKIHSILTSAITLNFKVDHRED